jgi:hypothetical protein
MKRLFILAVPIAALFLGGHSLGAAEIQIGLRADKGRYHFGDTVEFVMTFRNVSARAIRIFRSPEPYDTRVLSLFGFQGRAKAKALELVELSTYFDSWAKEVETLQPQQVSARRIRAKLRGRLPVDWNDRTPGIYLVFEGGTAFMLPSFGRYSVVANYRFAREHPVVKYIPVAGPPIWFGGLTSPVVILDFQR